MDKRDLRFENVRRLVGLSSKIRPAERLEISEDKVEKESFNDLISTEMKSTD